MRARFDHPAVLQHDDPVGVADRGQPVRDHEAGAPLEQPRERRLDQPLGVAVDACGRFIEDQDLGIGDQGAGEADQLPLPERQVAAPLLQRGVHSLAAGA